LTSSSPLARSPKHRRGNLRADRLCNDLDLPIMRDTPESAALLYMRVTVHHDVIAQDRFAQLGGAAFWHLRVKLTAFVGGFLLDPSELGNVPELHERQS
jgi:hypothetical protein